ncbi:methylenetetrahydrofolate reductase [uncultured Sphaerochaeta sp.]|uniref:methylenetetrahydrofolate reductase n=1 Tax=uncultured Sphaerochaeta sp. TaxID=886478 RepID=UPI002A0A1E5A|nr:methylenetetrahydrofolate reductase [uncultured Sphaerochaeta sp.]
MKVTDILSQAKKPLFTFELVPPLKGGNAQMLLDTVKQLSEYEPAYINVTNHQREIIYIERPDGLLLRKTVHKRPGTVALSALIQYTFGIPVVAHLICGGMTSDEIEDTLVELNFLGIDNVLALRGDPPVGEKRFVPVEGGYSHSDELVSQIVRMNEGHYLDLELKTPQKTDFCIGVAGYPEKHGEAPNLTNDMEMLKRKVASGAGYIVTQMFFDNAAYYRFVAEARKAGITVPIIPGIKPIGSKRDLQTIPQTFHVDFPSVLVDLLARANSLQEVREVGIHWCTMQAKDLIEHGVPGVHFYTLGKAESVSRVVKAVY